MEEMIKSKEDEIERLMLELKEHNEKASATTSENTDVQQIQTLMVAIFTLQWHHCLLGKANG